MDNERSEANGFRVLLHVTNLAPNALISSLYPQIDLFSNSSNHHIAIGPKLEGKTVHVRALFLEYMVIL